MRIAIIGAGGTGGYFGELLARASEEVSFLARVLALRACAEEDKDGWVCLLQDLRRRGATQIDLTVTDGHDGLLAAVSHLFSATPPQRCLIHKQRNALNAIPRRERPEVAAELAGIWEQPTKSVC